MVLPFCHISPIQSLLVGIAADIHKITCHFNAFRTMVSLLWLYYLRHISEPKFWME